MANPNLTFSAALAAALADHVAGACISPGSRNAPLIAGFAAEHRIERWTILDERSAGFFGVGLARATGKPVVLISTSGTAAAQYHAAVIEARQSNVPLIVLTADRPPELRGIGAPQTIDQVALFGSSPLLFRDLPPPDDGGPHPGEIAAEAVATATRSGGPVHLNLPFREPLLTGKAPAPASGRGTRYGPQPQAPEIGEWVDDIAGRRGLIVAGRSVDRTFPQAVARLAAVTGFPILADPLSGIRHGRHSQDLVLGYGDVLAAAGILDRLPPEIVIRLGPIPTSKAIWKWLEDHPETHQILAEPSGLDATRSATLTLAASTSAFAQAVAERVTSGAPAGWADDWMRADAVAGEAVRRVIDDAPFPSEPAIARNVIANCPSGTLLTVGSSMPVRDVDAYGGRSSRTIRFFGNRGTNGIDGVVSSALGTAASGGPAMALVGDVSLFHDLNVLGTMAQLDLPLTVIVINNDGGGIFHLLPQADPTLMDPDTFETYLGTPHGTDFVAVAGSLGVDSRRIDGSRQLAEVLSEPFAGPRLLELRTDREQNAALHRKIAIAVARVLR